MNTISQTPTKALLTSFNKFTRSPDARRAFMYAIVSPGPLFLLLGPTGWSTESISKLPRTVVQGLQPTGTVLAGWVDSDTVVLQIPLPTRMPEVSGHKSPAKAAYDQSLAAMRQALLDLTTNKETTNREQTHQPR